MNRPTPYLQKTLRHRRARFVARRWRIQSDPQGQGVFSCSHVIPGTALWEEMAKRAGLPEHSSTQTHARIHFLSQNRVREGWVYCARLSTVEQKVCELIEEQVEKDLEDEGFDVGPRHWMARHEAWKSFGPQQWERLPVFVGVERDLKSPLAVNLDVVLDTLNLDALTLRRFVERFWGHKEQPFRQEVDWPAHRAGIQQMVDDTAEVFARLASSRLE